MDWHMNKSSVMRECINQNIPWARQVMRHAGCYPTITLAPPPMIGGNVMRNVDPFSMIFNPPHGVDIVGMVTDMIEQTIGVLNAPPNKTVAAMKPAGDIVPTDPSVLQADSDLAKPPLQPRVFVVHGHDEGMKNTVARFIESLGAQAVILHECASQGRTIIEKFEAHADVDFAVALLSPDDVGSAVVQSAVQSLRARQNVVFELGYFFGRLGRGRVVALLKDEIERPSDIEGLIYIAFDNHEGWKLKLAKEFKSAGLAIQSDSLV